MSTGTSMITDNPLKSMLQFALPLLVGNLLQQTYNIIDAAIVGQTLGAKALAAVGASSSVQFLVLGFSGRAFFSGVMEMIARTVVSLGFVGTFGYTAICFADQTAWIAACVYIFPTCLYCMKKVTGVLRPETAV